MVLLKFVLLLLCHGKYYGIPYLQMHLAYLNFRTRLSKTFASESLCSQVWGPLGDDSALSGV